MSWVANPDRASLGGAGFAPDITQCVMQQLEFCRHPMSGRLCQGITGMVVGASFDGAVLVWLTSALGEKSLAVDEGKVNECPACDKSDREVRCWRCRCAGVGEWRMEVGRGGMGRGEEKPVTASQTTFLAIYCLNLLLCLMVVAIVSSCWWWSVSLWLCTSVHMWVWKNEIKKEK